MVFQCLEQLALVHDVHEHRPQERGRLAAPGLGDADHVAAGQQRGHALRLVGG